MFPLYLTALIPTKLLLKKLISIPTVGCKHTQSCERVSVLTGVLYLYEGVGQDGGVGCWWDSLRWLRGGESWRGEGGAALGFLPLLPLHGWWWWWWEGVTRACNKKTHTNRNQKCNKINGKRKKQLNGWNLKQTMSTMMKKMDVWTKEELKLKDVYGWNAFYKIA